MTSAHLLWNCAMNSYRGFSLIEVLIALLLLSVTSIMIFSYLQQVAISDLRQWQLSEGWRAAAQFLEGNRDVEQQLTLQEFVTEEGCLWRQVQVDSERRSTQPLVQLSCAKIN